MKFANCAYTISKLRGTFCKLCILSDGAKHSRTHGSRPGLGSRIRLRSGTDKSIGA